MASHDSAHQKGGVLTPRQRRAIPLLIAAPTVQAGCETAKIAPRTYYDWLAQPTFREALTAARDAVVKEGFARLRAGLQLATDGLLELAKAANQDAVRLGACRAIVDYVVKVQEIAALDERIKALEKLAASNSTTHTGGARP